MANSAPEVIVCPCCCPSDQRLVFCEGHFDRVQIGAVGRQGADPVTAAKAGRWSDANLPVRIYAHAATHEAEVRACLRTNYVQPTGPEMAKHKKTKKIRKMANE